MEPDAEVRIARAAAVRAPAELLAAVRAFEGAPDELAATLRRHHLGQLVLNGLADEVDGDPTVDELRAALLRRRIHRAVGWRELLTAYEEARDSLEAAGVGVMLLKGALLAQRLYGDLDRRPQYDIDLLVRRDDARTARRVLRDLGYQRRGRDRHSVTLSRDDVHVDLHHALRAAPAYRIAEDELWAASEERPVAWTTARGLSDEHTLLLLVVSMVEDVGFGMAKLKQLCDLWLLLQDLDPHTDWDAWFARRDRENLRAIAANGAALVVDVLDAAREVPRLAASLERQHAWTVSRDRQTARALVSAGRDTAGSMEWFATIYPGSLVLYRAHSFVAGFPGTLHELRPSRLRSDARALRARLRERRSERVV